MAEKINNNNVYLPSDGTYLYSKLTNVECGGAGEYDGVKYSAAVKLKFTIRIPIEKIVSSSGLVLPQSRDVVHTIRIPTVDEKILELYEYYFKFIDKKVLIKLNVTNNQNYSLSDDFEILEVK
jgi:hypothetical protein